MAYPCSERLLISKPDVVFDLPEMGMSRIHIVSALNALRSGFGSFPNLEENVCSDKSVLHIRGLLDKKDTLFHQRGYNSLSPLEKRDRSSLYGRLKKSTSRFEPSSVRGKDSQASSSKSRKPNVAFSGSAGTSQHREKLASHSSDSKKARKSSDTSKSSDKGSKVPSALSAPKGNFRKNPKE